MKKSFIMTVAVSMALSAVAEDTGYISGTSFEGISLGEKSSVELIKDANDSGVVDNVCYWSTDAWKTENSADYEGFFVVTNISGDTSYPESRPEYWNGKGNSNALVIDTDKPLDRFIHDPENGGISSESLEDTNVFFDSVVQFTATDVSPTPVSSIDKLLVWLYTSPEDITEENPGLFNETEPITTLVVTAGYYKENDNTLYKTNYCVAADTVSIKPDEWHRLTIKAFTSNDGAHALFNVYVDGKKVKTEGGEDGTSDFISLKDDSASIATIIGVAFDGKGMVDDIVFTTKAPDFAKDAEAEKYAFTLNFTENVNIRRFEINGVSCTPVSSGVSYEVAVGNLIYLLVEPATGYTLTFNGGIFTPDEFGGYEYYFTPNNAGSGAVTITATQNAGVPTVGGNPIVIDPTTDKITNITTANNGQAVVGELDISKFHAYYTVSVTDGKLSIALDQKAAAPFAETTDLTEGQEVFDLDETMDNETPAVGVRIRTFNGLYYGLAIAAELGSENWNGPASWEKSDKDGKVIQLKAPKQGDTGFYKIEVRDVIPTSAQ